MAITYASATGTAITSHAMDETLVDQSLQTGNNTIIVSDDLSTAGNGQIGDGTNGIGNNYVGRLIILNLGRENQQIRFCIAEEEVGSPLGPERKLTVHEDWDTNPSATGSPIDTVHVPYEPADAEDSTAGAGVKIDGKTGAFVFTNDVTIWTSNTNIIILSLSGVVWNITHILLHQQKQVLLKVKL